VTIIFLAFLEGWTCFGSDPQRCKEDVKASLENIFQEKKIQFRLDTPKELVFKTVYFTSDSASEWGFSDYVAGITPEVSCKNNPYSVSLVFNCRSDTIYCANVAAHEIGHSFGLEHVTDSRNFMRPTVGGVRFGVGRTLEKRCREIQDDKAIIKERL